MRLGLASGRKRIEYYSMGSLFLAKGDRVNIPDLAHGDCPFWTLLR